LAKNIKVTKESDSGRNQQFQVGQSGRKVSRADLVKEIEAGKHPDYHVREVNGVKTPVSNPDSKEGNNLG